MRFRDPRRTTGGSIDNNSLWSPETLSWTLEVKSIKMSVLGTPHYDTLVSNIDQSFLGVEHAGPRDKVAQSFMTPPGPLGQQYPLHRVHINAASQYPTQATVDLHTDDDGAPGDHLASMIMPGDFAPGELTPDDLITVAPRHTNLNPGTRYWIVISNEQEFNVLRISVTRSKAQDPTSLEGWEVDNQKARAQSDNSWRLLAAPIQMAILGSAPFIRTNEADGPDLPGAGSQRPQNGRSRNPRHRQHWSSDRQASTRTTVYTATTGGSTPNGVTATASRSSSAPAQTPPPAAPPGSTSSTETDAAPAATPTTTATTATPSCTSSMTRTGNT